MREQKEFTFLRFLYLNTYAFLLAFWGIGILLLPLHHMGWIYTVIQVVGFIIFEKFAIKLFSSWSDKRRKYVILMDKNSKIFYPETFSEYMQAPCGRLLTKVVLNDLNLSDRYPQLLKLKQPLLQRIQMCYKPNKTVIYINDKEL